jgi:hypothetical protein
MTEEPKAAKAAADTDKGSSAPLGDRPPTGPELVERLKAGSAVASTAEPAQTGSGDAGQGTDAGLVQRRSRWYSSLAALKYVSSLSKDDDVRVRDSDRATSIFLLISAILTVLSLLVPPLAPHRLALVLVCDALVGLMLVFYVANRFGILNTLTPRQALLSWQLMMGAAFLGIFTTINLAVAIALIVAHMALP